MDQTDVVETEESGEVTNIWVKDPHSTLVTYQRPDGKRFEFAVDPTEERNKIHFIVGMKLRLRVRGAYITNMEEA